MKDNLTNPIWGPYAPSAASNIEDERVRFWHAIEANGNRLDSLERDMHQTVTRAVKDAMPTALLSDDEHRWIQLAIKQKTQSIEFRQSVIDKTLTAFVWALIVGFGIIIKEYLAAHGWKP